MTIDMSQFYQVFFDESAEHLAEMERLLLVMNVESPDMEELNAIFRAAHSIKGGSGTFGFSDMTKVTHVLENLLDRLRKGEMSPQAEMIDVFLQAADVLKEQLNCHIQGVDAEQSIAEDVCEKLRALADQQDLPLVSLSVPPSKNNSSTLRVDSIETSLNEGLIIPSGFEIYFYPSKDFFNSSNSIDGLVSELSRLGSVIVEEQHTGKFSGKNSKKVKKTKKISSKVGWKFCLESNCSRDLVEDIFSFIAEPDQYSIVTLDLPTLNKMPSVEEDEAYGFFDESIADDEESSYGFFSEPNSPQIINDTEQEGDGFGFFVPLAPVISETKTTSSVAEPSTGHKIGATQKSTVTTNSDSSIRVSVERVDQLINLVGELVITQAMLAQTASTADPLLYKSLHNGLAQLERNTRDLQESVMSIRMMPISFVFSRFPRVVRDLAAKLNKQVELITIGENTELDKGLIEKIADPLTHLVRNSLDHGIELPETRIAAGKPAKGTITLSASHQSGSIVIEVSDDGAGLNRAKILSKAYERGLHVSEDMPDNQVWMLIFEPGFSTADVITDVSGRGVGMDVVRRNISEMGGSIEIESFAGVGSKIIVQLPLTLAILDGMTVSSDESIYVVPLNMIVETLQPQPKDIKTITGQGHLVQVRGEYLPIISLRKLFNASVSDRDACDGVLVLIEAKNKKAALLVDALVGQQQVVIKSLETNYRKIPGISGGTIMGDGKVALIIDVPAMIKMGEVTCYADN